MNLLFHYELKIFVIINSKLNTYFYKLSWYWSLITIEKQLRQLPSMIDYTGTCKPNETKWTLLHVIFCPGVYWGSIKQIGMPIFAR